MDRKEGEIHISSFDSESGVRVQKGGQLYLEKGRNGMDRYGSSANSGYWSSTSVGTWRQGTRRCEMDKQNKIGTEERSKEISSGNQHDSSKYTHGKVQDQVRRTGSGHVIGENGMVDVYLGSKRGLFPRFSTRRFSAIPCLQMERGLVSLPGPPIWSPSVSLHFSEDNEASPKVLEKEAVFDYRLPRRFLGNSKFKNGSFVHERGDCQGHGEIGFGSSTRERLLGACSRGGGAWNDNRFKEGRNSSSRAKDSSPQNRIEGITDSRKASTAYISKNSGYNHQLQPGLFPSKVIHQKVLQADEANAIQQVGLGLCSSNFRGNEERCRLDSKQRRQVQWKVNFQAFSCGGCCSGCVRCGLGRRLEWKRKYWGSMVDKGSIEPHQRQRSNCLEKSPGDFGRQVEREKSAVVKRQPGSSGVLEQWWRPLRRSLSTNSLDLGVGSNQRDRNHWSRMDSRKIEYNSRFYEQDSRFRRLDSRDMGLQHSSKEMGPTFNRSYGLRHQHKSGTIQLENLVPRDKSSELFYSGLEESCELGGTTNQENHSSDKSRDRMQGQSNAVHTSMGNSTLVASVESSLSGENNYWRKRSSSEDGPVWKQVLNRSSLDMDIVSNRWDVSSLIDVAKQFKQKSRSATTIRNEAYWWNQFSVFCSLMELPVTETSADVILAFIGWVVKVLDKPKSCRIAIIALSNSFDERRIFNATKTLEVQRVVDGVMRDAARLVQHRPPRLPLPISALRKWLSRKPPGMSEFVWRRNAAIIVIGLRGIRRPGELGIFRRKDIRKVDGVFYLTLPWSKTDQEGRGKVIPIEPSDNISITCPVYILERYLELLLVQKENDPLFSTAKNGNKAVSGAMVSSIVKEMAKYAGLEGNYSGHSLRIGGATLMLRSGFTMAQIRAIGGWESKAVQHYLTAIALSDQGISTKMGF